MRVVAAGAAGGRHRIIHVLFDEIRPVRLVTLNTEPRNALFKKEAGVTRCMGVMAGKAPLGHRVVLEPGFGDRFPHLLVTSETEVVSLFDKVELAVSAVGVVAFHAAPLSHYLVDAFRVIWHHLIVAGVANPVGIGCQQLSMTGCVGIMAANAITFFERSMDKRLR